MYCNECGTEISKGSNFCPSCGKPVLIEPIKITEPDAVNTPEKKEEFDFSKRYEYIPLGKKEADDKAAKAEDKKEEFDFSKRYDNKPRNSESKKEESGNNRAYYGGGQSSGSTNQYTGYDSGKKTQENYKKTYGDGIIMSPRNTAIVAYITTLGFIIALIAGDREKAKFHLNQALLVHLFFCLAAVPFVGWAWGIFMIVIFIMGLSNAINGIESPLPLIGNIRIFDR